jgi:hypothetical protein
MIRPGAGDFKQIAETDEKRCLAFPPESGTLRLSSGCGTASKRRNSPQDGVRKGWLVGPAGTGRLLCRVRPAESRESSACRCGMGRRHPCPARRRKSRGRHYAAAFRRYAVSRVSANAWRSMFPGTVFASRSGVSGLRL